MLQEMKSNNLSCQSGQPKGNRGLVKPLRHFIGKFKD